jgi:hypothetical protein
MKQSVRYKEIWKPILKDNLRYSKLLKVAITQPKYCVIFFIFLNIWNLVLWKMVSSQFFVKGHPETILVINSASFVSLMVWVKHVKDAENVFFFPLEC